MLFLILHKVRGEPAFDIAECIGAAEDIWIIPTSGHRCYPYRKWALEDLIDVSDINASGYHCAPWSFDHTLPPDWPDHYDQSTLSHTPKPKTSIEDLLI